MFRRKNDKRIVELNSEELRLAKHALLEFRNKLIAEGKPAEDINELLLKLSNTPPEQLLEEFLGHTPLQVACGALLGAAVAILYSLP